jgi:alpha-beta hydrolase superfamily lysophospholipase
MGSRFVAVVTLACLALVSCSAKESVRPDLVLKAKDGTPVYAYLTKAPKKSDAVILMFHQAGSNAGEYTPIIPEFTKIGYDCLAVDQRSGGGMFGRVNRTATNYRGRASYVDAYQDLEAALEWAKGKGYKKIVAWGSSYSAALTLRLASEHGADLKAALAFSPGEYMPQQGVVRQWASKAKVPIFYSAMPSEAKESVQGFLDTMPKDLKAKSELCSDADSIHGSSTIRADRNPRGYRLCLEAAKKFLRRVFTAG